MNIIGKLSGAEDLPISWTELLHQLIQRGHFQDSEKTAFLYSILLTSSHLPESSYCGRHKPKIMEVCSNLMPQVPTEGVMWHMDRNVLFVLIPSYTRCLDLYRCISLMLIESSLWLWWTVKLSLAFLGSCWCFDTLTVKTKGIFIGLIEHKVAGRWSDKLMLCVCICKGKLKSCSRVPVCQEHRPGISIIVTYLLATSERVGVSYTTLC